MGLEGGATMAIPSQLCLRLQSQAVGGEAVDRGAGPWPLLLHPHRSPICASQLSVVLTKPQCSQPRQAVRAVPSLLGGLGFLDKSLGSASEQGQQWALWPGAPLGTSRDLLASASSSGVREDRVDRCGIQAAGAWSLPGLCHVVFFCRQGGQLKRQLPHQLPHQLPSRLQRHHPNRPHPPHKSSPMSTLSTSLHSSQPCSYCL